jgi:hypothetical protein
LRARGSPQGVCDPYGACMKAIRGQWKIWGGAVALAALSAALATPADAKVRRHRHAPAPAESQAFAFNSFTPAAADPRFSFGVGDAYNGGAFSFTPSNVGNNRRAITVAVRSRAITRQQAARAMALPSDGLAPSAYSLGASIGWKRFALSGDVQKIDGGLLPNGRESADLGLVFSGKRWATELEVAGERATGQRLPVGPTTDESFSVGLSSSYAVSRRLNVTGGVRYKQQHEQVQALTDDRRDSQTVYLGTTFKF